MDRIRKLAKVGARNMGKEDKAVRDLFHKLGGLLIKDAALLQNRIPSSPLTEVDNARHYQYH